MLNTASKGPGQQSSGLQRGPKSGNIACMLVSPSGCLLRLGLAKKQKTKGAAQPVLGCIADVLTCPVARTSPFSDENGQIELQGRCSFLSRSQLIIGIIGASKGLILLYALAKKCTPCCHADQPLYARWLRVAVPDLHMEQVNAVEKTRCLQQLATASKGSASHRQRMGPAQGLSSVC